MSLMQFIIQVSKHAISLKFFLSTGASIIPRSMSAEHLQQNLELVSDRFSLTDSEMSSLGWPDDLL